MNPSRRDREAEDSDLAKIPDTHQGKPFSSQDLKNAARPILQAYYRKRFKIVEDMKKFDKILEQLKKRLSESRQFYLILNKGNQKWVLLSVLETSYGDLYALYKDPSGEELEVKYKQSLEKMFPRIQVLEHKNTEKVNVEVRDYGYLTLANLKHLHDKWLRQRASILDEF